MRRTGNRRSEVLGSRFARTTRQRRDNTSNVGCHGWNIECRGNDNHFGNHHNSCNHDDAYADDIFAKYNVHDSFV